MFGQRLRLFRLYGIPVSLDLSWLIILALLSWTLTTIFRQALPGLSPGVVLVMGISTALAFFTCIVLHELGHALVARSVGMPIRGITLFLFGGVAEIEDEPPSARSEFLMAIAGPIVSAVLAAVFWLLSGLVTEPAVALPLQYLAWINVAVLVFNLVPAFPLDGGRVLRSVLWAVMDNLRRATYWASQIGQGFAVFLIAMGVLQFLAGFIIQGIWLGLIGLFLSNAARGGYERVLIRQVLQGEPVGRFMNPNPIVVEPWIDLRAWVEDYVYRHHRKFFPVVSDGNIEGVITTQSLAKYPQEEWSKRTVAEVMERDIGPLSISPQADALQALSQIERTGCSRLLVVEEGRLIGIISLKDLLRFLNIKLELDEIPRRMS